MHYRCLGGSKHADCSEFATRISRVLITNPVPDHFDAIVLQNEAAKRDICIEWTSIVSPNYDVDTLVGIGINTTSSKDTLGQAFFTGKADTRGAHNAKNALPDHHY